MSPTPRPHDLFSRFLPGLCVALQILPGFVALAGEHQVWTAQYPLLPGGTVTVENVQGNITVEGWDRAGVEVVATKTSSGSSDTLDGVRILVDTSEHHLAIRTLYPMQSEDSLSVDYQLRVPRQVRLDRLRTVSGDIVVRQIEGSVDARSLNGNILQVGVVGRVVARAITGNIYVRMGALGGDSGPLRLDTVSGDVVVVLPPRPNADLEVRTVAGRIESRYLFAASGAPGDTAQRARLGRGGVSISLRTVRGNITVLEGEEDL